MVIRAAWGTCYRVMGRTRRIRATNLLSYRGENLFSMGNRNLLRARACTSVADVV